MLWAQSLHFHDRSATAGAEKRSDLVVRGPSLEVKRGVVLPDFQEEQVSVAESSGEGGLGITQLGLQRLGTLQHADTRLVPKTTHTKIIPLHHHLLPTRSVWR